MFSAVTFSEPEPQTDFDEIPSFDQAKIAAAEPELDAEGDELMKFYPVYLVAHRGILPDLRPDVSRSSGIDLDVDEVDEDRDFVDLDYAEYLTYSDTKEVSSAELSVDQETGQNSYIDLGFELPLDDGHEFLLQNRSRLFTARSLKWISGITLMIALAIGQIAFFRMSVYAQMTEYRPTYTLVCRYLGCEVPEYENHDELRTRELVIRSHPDEPEALVVDVLLLNSGPYKQAFPGLWLQFYDVHGYVVASRVFRANEYLDGEMRGLKLIPAETEVRLSLELIDPGTDALGYQMEVVPL